MRTDRISTELPMTRATPPSGQSSSHGGSTVRVSVKRKGRGLVIATESLDPNRDSLWMLRRDDETPYVMGVIRTQKAYNVVPNWTSPKLVSKTNEVPTLP